MSHLIPNLIDSVAKGDMPKSMKLAQEITVLLRKEKPDQQWHANDTIVSSLISENTPWTNGCDIPKLVGNLFFFSRFDKAKVDKIKLNNGSLFLYGDYTYKEAVVNYLVEKKILSIEEILDNPSVMSIPIGRIQGRWEYLCSKNNPRKQKQLTVDQKLKLIRSSNEKYIIDLKEMGLDANLQEYLTAHFKKEKAQEPNGPSVSPSSIVSMIAKSMSEGDRALSLELASKIDKFALQRGGDAMDTNIKLKMEFTMKLFGVEADPEAACKTMVENFFILPQIGVLDVNGYIKENPGLLDLKLSTRWGVINYVVGEIGVRLEDVWKNPFKLSAPLHVLVPRHQYYLAKGKVPRFGASRSAPLGIHWFGANSDELYVQHLQRGGVPSTLAEYRQFSESALVKSKFAEYSQNKGPSELLSQKVKEIAQKREEAKTNFYLRP